MLSTSSLVLLASIAGTALCQTVQDDWLSPSTNEIWYTRQTNTITWDSDLQTWFDYYCPACDTSNVDLWITGTSENFYLIQCSSPFLTRRGAVAYNGDVAAVNVQTDKSFHWKIPDTSMFTSTTSMSSETSPSMTTTETTSSTSPAATTSSPATTAHSHGGLSTGAKAGIGVGAEVGAVVLFALGFLLAKKQQQNKAAAAGGGYSQASTQPYPPQHPPYTQSAAYADQTPSWSAGHSPQPWNSQGGSGYGNAFMRPSLRR
ncbi:hypothetical protein GGR57DRAFT_513742 [Xylariaceae sp. FL1272]|nr:hypothetical protein GGR57DRAFT_513742 [Xylariaceae sp. FL1272]